MLMLMLMLKLMLMRMRMHIFFLSAATRFQTLSQQPHGNGNQQAGYADGTCRISFALFVGADCILTHRDYPTKDDTKSVQQQWVTDPNQVAEMLRPRSRRHSDVVTACEVLDIVRG